MDRAGLPWSPQSRASEDDAFAHRAIESPPASGMVKELDRLLDRLLRKVNELREVRRTLPPQLHTCTREDADLLAEINAAKQACRALQTHLSRAANSGGATIDWR